VVDLTHYLYARRMRMKKRVFRVLVLMLVFLAAANIVFLTGCKRDRGGKTNRVGISMPTQSTERWVTEGNEMVAKLRGLGYDTILQFAEDRVEQQVSQIENMLNRGIDVLICCPIDGGALDGVLRRVKDAGAMVIAYDRLLTDTQYVDYYMTFDSIAIGGLMGSYIVDALGVRQGGGPFNIELFAGSLDDNNTELYFNGAMDQLRPFMQSGQLVVKSGQTALAQTSILGWAAEVAQARMDNILTANYADGSLVHGVLSPYDGLSLGIISSLKAVGYGSANRPFPVITGQDAELPSVKSILAGEQTQTVLLDLFALAGGAVTVADQYMKGGAVTVINKPDFYNNGVKTVPAYAINAISVDRRNVIQEAVRVGLYTEAEMRN
jgi:putative multiple sugar transport system substrate-binding protein